MNGLLLLYDGREFRSGGYVYKVTYKGNDFLLNEDAIFDPKEADKSLDGHHALTLTLAAYEQMAAETATYPGADDNQLIYPLAGLMGEAGEAAEVLARLFKEQHTLLRGPNDLDPAGVVLEAMARFGALMEVVKKTFRNDPPGELTADRREAIAQAADRLERVLSILQAVMTHRDRVVFPPIRPGPEPRLLKELGDVGYYWFRACAEAGLPAGLVALDNYAKLKDRARRGVLRSTGDDR